MMHLSAQQYATSLQNIQSRYIWLELLNYQYQTIEEISGICVSGSLSIDANSDIRRTGSIKLIINNSTFEVESGGKIWLDKYIRVWIGIKSLITGEIERVNCGMYLIDAPSYSYDPSNNNLTLSLLDLMAKLTGIRNGYLTQSPIVLKAGENIRQAIIKTLELAGFHKYIVEEAPSPGLIPNDLEFNRGNTFYDVLNGLKEIYPFYEMYFDIDGVFVYKHIPTGDNDPVLIRDDVWDNIVLSEDLSTNFQNVKNSIEVFGRIHEPEYTVFHENVSVSSSTITLSIPSIISYADDLIYGFEMEAKAVVNNPMLKVNDLTAYPILNDDGTKPTIPIEVGFPIFCVQYVNDVKRGKYWRWLGHLQAHGFAEDMNQESPYYINGPVGKIYMPLYDGEYANCITDDLAQQRAEYELYMHTNMSNSVNLKCVPIYWFDVNILTEYTLKRNNKKSKYLIKSINLGLAPTDSMTINMIQFYPNSPSIIQEK